jgi:hypothetical protein
MQFWVLSVIRCIRWMEIGNHAQSLEFEYLGEFESIFENRFRSEIRGPPELVWRNQFRTKISRKCTYVYSFNLPVCLSSYTVKKAWRNSDVDNSGANQTMWGSENFYSHVVWFCATVVSIGIWRIPTWLFYSVSSLVISPFASFMYSIVSFQALRLQ